MKQKLHEEHLPSKVLEIDAINAALREIPFLGFKAPETFGDEPIDISGDFGLYPEDVNRAVDKVETGLFESFNLKVKSKSLNESDKYYEIQFRRVFKGSALKDLVKETGVQAIPMTGRSLVIDSPDKENAQRVFDWLKSKGYDPKDIEAFNESKLFNGQLFENLNQRVRHMEAIVADLKRDLKEKRRLKTRAENQMRVPDAHKLTTEVEDMEAELSTYEKGLQQAREWMQNEGAKSKKKKLTEAPQLTLSVLDKLARMGGGYGFLGDRLRNPQSFTRESRGLTDIIDKAFIEAAKDLKLELWHAAAFGDSKDGRYLCDHLTDFLMPDADSGGELLRLWHKGDKESKDVAKSENELLKKSKERTKEYMQKFFKSLKRENMDELQKEWLEKFKEAGLK